MLPMSALEIYAKPSEPTFLTVDIEGADLAVLEGNDWNSFKPRVIAVEEHGVRPMSESAVRSLLLGKGYELLAQACVTSIFVHAKYLEAASRK